MKWPSMLIVNMKVPSVQRIKFKSLTWKACCIYVKKNVKCTLVHALRLCTGRTAHMGSRGIALIFLDYGTRRAWVVGVTLRPLFTPGKDPIPIVWEAVWAPGPVWTGAENLDPTGIRSPDRPARSQSLYRLRYPAHFIYVYFNNYAKILLLSHKCFIFYNLCENLYQPRKMRKKCQTNNIFSHNNHMYPDDTT